MRLLLALLFAAAAIAQPPGASLPGMTTERVCVPRFSVASRSEHPVSANLRRRVILRDGYPAGAKGLIIDHIIPVELGGSNAIDNLQVQKKADAHQKDLLENKLHKLVCDGSLSLAQAQWEISHNWLGARFVYLGPLKTK